MTHGLYEVVGKRAYRGHPPGSTFEAKLDKAVEFRAVQRGDIRVVERVTPTISPDRLVFPEGWPDPPQSTAAPAHPEAAKAASPNSGGR